jgi:hypothetical protein
MSIGSWNPDTPETNTIIDPTWLERFIAWADQDQLHDLSELMEEQEQQSLAGLMQRQQSEWLEIAEQFNDHQLQSLIRFFTIAENLPGWSAGEKSPVIALARTLRKRGHKMDREFLLWIREFNDNRFLPYGPL